MSADRQMSKLREMYERSQAQLGRIKDKAEEQMGVAMQTMTVGVASFGAGFVRGRFGEIAPAGVPVDLGAGLALHLVGYTMAGKYKESAHNLGDGLLAAYLTTLGAGIGTKMRAQKSGTATGADYAIGYDQARALNSAPARGMGSTGLTPADIAAIHQ